MKKSFFAFTLVELIVVITILAILGTIGFVSLQGYGVGARDATRLSDLNTISRGLEYFHLQENRYPNAAGGFNISYLGSELWTQGTFNDAVVAEVRRVPVKPVDPLTGDEYLYSVTYNNQEYQVGATFEGGGSISMSQSQTYANFSGTRILGNYNGAILGKNIGSDRYIFGIPSLITSAQNDIDLLDIISNRLLIKNTSSALPFGRASQNQSPTLIDFSSASPTDVIVHNSNQEKISAQDLVDITERLIALYGEGPFQDNGNIQNILNSGGTQEAQRGQVLSLIATGSSTRNLIDSSISYNSTLLDSFTAPTTTIAWNSTQTRVISDYITFVGTYPGFDWDIPISFTTGGDGNPTADLGDAPLRGSSGTFADGTNLEMDVPPLGETYTSYLYVDGVTISFTISRENDPSLEGGEPDSGPSGADHIVSVDMQYYWGATYEFAYISFVEAFPGRGFSWGTPIDFVTSGPGNPQILSNSAWISSGSFTDGTQMRVEIPGPGETRTVYLEIEDFTVEYNLTRPANP